MKYWVYILQSEPTMKYYIGQTQDIEKRLVKHNSGYVISTRNGKPWKLIFREECDNRSEAMKLEKKIKGRGAGRFLTEPKNSRDVAQSGPAKLQL